MKSSWFPLYDRSPQTFVPNIFFASILVYHLLVFRLFSIDDTTRL